MSEEQSVCKCPYCGKEIVVVRKTFDPHVYLEKLPKALGEED